MKVCDQYGRPCKGTLTPDGKPILFSRCSHAQAIEALVQERIDWSALNCAGWPQLPYAKLREIEHLPWFQRLLQASMTADTHGTYLDELRKIKNPEMRKDAIRFWRDVEAEKTKELQEATEE